MQILLYSPSGDEFGERLRQALSEVLRVGRVEVLRQLNGLIQRLRMPISALGMLIFVPANRQELSVVSSFLTEMPGLQIVLVLPDRESETLAMARTLRPRFLAYLNGDYSELMEVVKEILNDSAKSESDVNEH